MNSFGTPPGGGWGQPPQAGGFPPQQPGAHGAPQGYGAAAGAPQGYPAAPQGYGAAAGAPQGYPAAPQGYGAAAGAPPGPPNAYAANQAAGLARAQGVLGQTGNTLKMMRLGFVGLGGLLALAGIYSALTSGLMTGLGLLITGGVLAGVGWFSLPQFIGILGQASAQVDALAHKQQLAMTGVPATGRLLQVQQTGRLVNYNPEVAALVEVHHPQHGMYQVQTTAVVPQIAIPQAQPGAQVHVRINPTNPQDIALVF